MSQVGSFSEPFKTFPLNVGYLNLFSTYCPPEPCCFGLCRYYPSLTRQSYTFLPENPMDPALYDIASTSSYFIKQFGYSIHSERGTIDFYRVQVPPIGEVEIPSYMLMSTFGYISCLFIVCRDETIEGGSIVFATNTNQPYWLKYYKSKDYSAHLTPTEDMGIIYKAESFYSMEPIKGSGYLYMIRCSFPIDYKQK